MTELARTPKPVVGSLILTRWNGWENKYSGIFDVWGIVISNKHDSLVVGIIEVVPEKYEGWEGYDGLEIGKELDVHGKEVVKVVQPRRKVARNRTPQFIVKLNAGRLCDIFQMGDSGPVQVRILDIARAYSAREICFHRDVLVTGSGMEGMEV